MVTVMILVIVTTLQVFFRYILNDSLTWSEEAARYFFVWSCYLGLAWTLSMGSHLEVTVIRSHMPEKIRVVFGVIGMLVTAVFCFYCAVFGLDAVLKFAESGQLSNACRIPLYWIWCCLPIGFFFSGIVALARGYDIAKGKIILDEIQE